MLPSGTCTRFKNNIDKGLAFLERYEPTLTDSAAFAESVAE